MTQNIKYSLVFLAGLAIGGFTGVMLTKQHFEDCKDEEIEELREYYDSRITKFEKHMDNKIQQEKFNTIIQTMGYDKSMNDMISAQKEAQSHHKGTKIVAEEKPDLSELVKDEREFPADDIAGVGDVKEENVPEEEDDLDEPQDVDEETLKNPNIKILKKEPYIIPEWEFSTDNTQEKVSITYYAGDDTLADEDDSILQVPDTIGWDALDNFDPNYHVVYVRNELLGIDYEVERVDASYSEYVLGVKPGDEEYDNLQKFKKKRPSREEE